MNQEGNMVYVYYHVTSVEAFKQMVGAYFEEGRQYGLEKLLRRGDQPDLYMEIITVDSGVGEPLKRLSDLRAKHGINKFILNNKIHVEVFEEVLGS